MLRRIGAARLTAFSGMTAVTRCPIGPVMAEPDLLAMVESALHESIAVARARQIPLAATAFEEILAAMGEMPPGTKSSMLEDLERGRPLEIDAIVTAVSELGRKVGVPTPTIDGVEALIRERARHRWVPVGDAQ